VSISISQVLQASLILIITILALVMTHQVIPVFSVDEAIAGANQIEPLTLIRFMDFNETTINETIWNFNIGNGCPNLCGWGNRELQYYTRENAFIENGNLVIEARREGYVDPLTGMKYNYTSARLDTIGKLKIAPPARIEVRAKLPKGKGFWPAIWMLGEEWSLENFKAWPACGEIDIMELVGYEPDVVHGTVHAPYCFGSRSVGSQYRLPEGMDFSQDYHVFGIEWTSDYIVWFVDGQIYHILTKSEFEKRGCIWVFDKPFHLIVNVAVGGYWPGNPDETTPFPARMYIDWIKIYRVNRPTYPFATNIVDSYNEIVAKTRGLPKAGLETVINGDFSKPIDLGNSPVVNPNEWYLTGRLDVIDKENTVVENGILKLVVKPPGPGPVGLKLGQVVWVYQNTSYIVRVRAWSSEEEQLVIRASLPIYPAKIHNETVVKLSTQPRYYELRFDNPPWGSNIVEVALIYNGTIDKDLVLSIDEVEICRVDACRPIIETSTTPPSETTMYTTPSTTKSTSSTITGNKTPSAGTTTGIDEGVLMGALVFVLIGVLVIALYLARRKR